MNLEIDVIINEKKTNVNLAGEIDVYTAPKLKEALLPLTKQENHVIEVYLDHVNYMDSTGLGVFIGILKSTKENNSYLRLVNLQERVQRLFKITGIDEVMDINYTIGGEQINGSI